MRAIPALIVLPAALCSGAVTYAAEYLTIPASQKALFPEADSFVDARVQLSDAQRDEIKRLSGVRQREAQQAVWRAEKQGQLLGWFIVDEVVGKHEFITYAAAISPQGKVLGVEVLIYRETYGYQVRDASWRDQFKGKTLQDAFKLDADVASVTGATLSCRNVTNGIKRLLALRQVVLQP
jgi:Na+-translocating ferredoxin:NAD+ oxidoreductase subunit G